MKKAKHKTFDMYAWRRNYLKTHKKVAEKVRMGQKKYKQSAKYKAYAKKYREHYNKTHQ